MGGRGISPRHYEHRQSKKAGRTIVRSRLPTILSLILPEPAAVRPGSLASARCIQLEKGSKMSESRCEEAVVRKRRG